MRCYPIAMEERVEQPIEIGSELIAPNSVEPHLVFRISPTLFEDSPTPALRLIMVNQSVYKVMTGPCR
jgi:hypothetical protein